MEVEWGRIGGLGRVRYGKAGKVDRSSLGYGRTRGELLHFVTLSGAGRKAGVR